MFPIDDVAGVPGGEQPVTPITPAPAEQTPTNVRGTVRQAYEQAQARAAEKDEARRVPAAKEAEPQLAPTNQGDSGEEPPRHPRMVDANGEPTFDFTRDAQGRFIKGGGQEPASVEKAVREAIEAAQAPLEGEVLRPPPGWNAAARAQFVNLPQEVKEAVAKREADVASGMQVLQHYRGLETYTPAIEASGISHAEFTKRAVEWEQSLRTNPIGTLIHVARLGNIDMVRLSTEILRQAQQNGQQQPQQQGAVQSLAPQQQSQWWPQQAPVPDFDSLINQKLAEREAHETVDDFLSNPKNIHAEAVADDMALLITNGRADDLEQAYDMACNMHPEIRALLIRQASATPAIASEAERARRTASEAKAAAKATIGAPSGPRPEPKDGPPDNSVRSTVRWAYNKHREEA